MLTPDQIPAIQDALAEAGLDGWLLFDFHGLNPVAGGLLGLSGMGTRRICVLIPREGVPIAITHAIEQGPWKDWPAEWDKRVYSGWRALESELASIVGNRRVAMEYSPGDAVPYLDRIPAGVLELVRSSGAEVVSSGELVSRFYARWSAADHESHIRAAERIAAIAREAFDHAGEHARSASRLTERELQQWILERFAEASLHTDHGPIVAIGTNAADPHYEPPEQGSATVSPGDVLLIDLWAREDNGVFADQTWMAVVGEPGGEVLEVWDAIRDARDAGIQLLRSRISAGEPVGGGEVDDAVREVITTRGFGDYFIHRTGHSIDSRDLHGSGPHIDNLETREERLLIPGVGFSIEPGIYIPGAIGMRTEVNAHVGDRELTVTPARIQQDLIVI